MTEKIERKLVVPGEVITSEEGYLPGDGTEKLEGNIVALKYGLAEEFNKIIKIIPLSGIYDPRRGNVVIGKVENITYYGWVIDIDSPEHSFLPLQEVPKYVSKEGLNEVLDIGDMVVAKILGVTNRGIDLTIKMRGLGKIDGGIIFKVNPSRVPRIIGKEGSMVSLLKQETNCNITVGQNGIVWVKGEKLEDELLAKKAMLFISENSFIGGLTEKVKEWFKKEANE